MIKVSSAPGEVFSINIEYKGHNVLMVGIPIDDSDLYDCDMKVFKDDVDVSEQFEHLDLTGDGLKKTLDLIDTF